MQKESQIAGNVRDNQAVSRGDDKLFNENNDPIDYSQSQKPAFPLSVTQSSKSPGQLTSTLSVKEALWPINEGDLQPYIPELPAVYYSRDFGRSVSGLKRS